MDLDTPVYDNFSVQWSMEELHLSDIENDENSADHDGRNDHDDENDCDDEDDDENDIAGMISKPVIILMNMSV